MSSYNLVPSRLMIASCEGPVTVCSVEEREGRENHASDGIRTRDLLIRSAALLHLLFRTKKRTF